MVAPNCRRAQRVPALAGHGDGVGQRRQAERGERRRQPDAARDRQNPDAQPAAGLAAAAVRLQCDGGEHDREQDREGDRSLGLAVPERSLQRRHAVEAADDRGRQRAGRDAERAGPQLLTARRQQRKHQQPAAGGRQRAAREREVHAHGERGGGTRGGDAQRLGARRVARQPRAQDEADRRQRPGRVPIGERLLEPPAGRERALEVHDAGQQASGETVADDHDDARGQDRLDRGGPAAGTPGQDARDQRAEVQRVALDVLSCGAGERRPVARPQHPARQRRESADRP